MLLIEFKYEEVSCLGNIQFKIMDCVYLLVFPSILYYIMKQVDVLKSRNLFHSTMKETYFSRQIETEGAHCQEDYFFQGSFICGWSWWFMLLMEKMAEVYGIEE